jgi:phytoene desaturase
MASIIVIGAGFSGLSAAAYLSSAGHKVHVYEKNVAPGGRARQLKTENGYVFDMGPSWYWMPGVYERFFNDFGYSAADFYRLKLLDPSFDVVFHDQKMAVPADFNSLCDLFESIEAGSSDRLKKFMAEAQYKYEAGMEKLAYMPGLSFREYASTDIIKSAVRLKMFSSFSKHVRKYFSHPKLIALMEFPVLFLGAMPQDTPALYSLMNYAGLKLGTWYPEGGFGKVVESIVKVAKLNGTVFHYNSPVEEIIIENGIASGIRVNGRKNILRWDSCCRRLCICRK